MGHLLQEDHGDPPVDDSFVSGDDSTPGAEEDFDSAQITTTDNINAVKEQVPVKRASFVHESNHDSGNDIPPRGKWAQKTEFILSCIGLSVGLGNIWRFPFLAYQNGGGAFLLPYIILMLLVGKPLYYLEVAIGQFTSSSVLKLWRCAPAFKGVGIAQLVIASIISIYYNVILCYTVFYMVQSFRSQLPWSSCAEWWGADEYCYVRNSGLVRCDVQRNRLVDSYIGKPPPENGIKIISSTNRTAIVDIKSYIEAMNNCTNATETASHQFWNKRVLGITEGIEHMGSLRWELALCLALCWAVVYLCLLKGVKSAGKVVYFTATFPYVILAMLLIKGLTLPGATTGILYYIWPDWSKVMNLQIWRKAAEQLFYSLGVAHGPIIVFGSYNDFRNTVQRDAVFISMMDFLTSLIGGFVIFSVLGNMSYELGIPISEVAMQGQGLAFVAYPEALSRLVWPHLWSFLFFFMLFLLGLDSEFAFIETVVTSACDERPSLRRHQKKIALAMCVICFFLGLPCVMQGGQYVLNLMDTYGGGISLLYLASFEMIGLAWVYGVKRISVDFEFMLAQKQSMYWKLSWSIFSPLILSFLFIYGLATNEKLLYGDKIPYPDWATGVGWGLALLSMLQVPIYFSYALYTNRQNMARIFQPTADWGPAEPSNQMSYKLMLQKQQ
ncbi:sodium- and chloride-dependent glycine transporter 2-like [Tropilaelaps mercedesae]|uniref:Transporter n=1 Tax=Tropilaelaps mercedesae TaxID=418985 RepID=A0A1V9XYQ2_9ACAR|nr:sodium- and chloride-dependent glycine transporter 2-like [Tropilaelaps mercedesae]